MAAPSSTEEDAIVGINVTPLVDITLVLLIVFMVTAKLIVSQTIPFDLPKAATSGETQVVFTVNIDAQGHVEANGRAVDEDALRQAAAGALSHDRDLRTVIQASTSVSHGSVIHVLDQLRRAGIQRIAFGVEKAAPRVEP